MIQRWDRLDYDALAGSARIIGFDLDNTLANSRKPMLPSVAGRSYWADIRRRSQNQKGRAMEFPRAL